MKTNRIIIGVLALIALAYGCKKEETRFSGGGCTIIDSYYSSGQDFLFKHNLSPQVYSINISSGGSFTTVQGTHVTLLPGSLVDELNNAIAGDVEVEFKDLYKKSDMLLADMPTNIPGGFPLKSGGEFFIRIKQGPKLLQLKSGMPITIEQPLNGLDLDMGMLPFRSRPDTAKWGLDPSDSVKFKPGNYLYSFYKFSTPLNNGSWGNSDNPNYFQGFSQTSLIVNQTEDPYIYGTQVFLFFKNVNSMIHIYRNYSGFAFNFNNAPVGTSCTIVAVGAKKGKVFSAFKEIVISENLNTSFSLSETTDDDFKKAVDQLNN